MDNQYGSVSDEAVQKATGKSWDEWFELLDEAGAEEMSHKEIAELLMEKGYIEEGGGWWAQSVTVGYEYFKGRRVKGQTADAGFQLGVQKTLPVEAEGLWQVITSPNGLEIWLGSGLHKMAFEAGETYRTAEGTTGEIRTAYPAERLRLTWQPADWENQSTLQLTLLDKGDKTALNFHHEKLSGPEQRKEMKSHWQQVLKQLKTLVDADDETK